MLTQLTPSRLRGILAERRISHTEFARVCGLSRPYLCRILCGAPAGELACIKIERAVHALGLELPVNQTELPRAS